MQDDYIKNISIKTLSNDILKGEGIVVLAFYAKWCEPCVELINVLKEVIQEEKKKMDIYKINFDKFREVSRGFEVTSLPTLIFLKNGKEKYRVTGSQTKKQIKVIISMID